MSERWEKMEIKYGAEVMDKTGKYLGTIDYIVRDTYTGDIRKFKVNTELMEADLFYSPDDVLEYSNDQVKLKNAFSEPGRK
jgi:sporulation protein YlmC with PRC-barrel domain